ncbi:hypothetical protein, conserved [Entamoeba dispar SAW760]|uniref:cysteine-S-conjugate beta-lyase n=1 Tax=Entamoeba dispar (strain ATCC PRA-260 / SAW760) TaxID=370354 RepID=B0E8I0_ENTDS|nr:uncharacterized protein EDI_127270 [Entamoeba dispar SAW760]EDR29161.1 hypothetical protein, conserved [Entamoeba dispar SAW760]|eukprot:EDR29161.1 hypothetical protein, conserved [Entamoeba dispar SAW760]
MSKFQFDTLPCRIGTDSYKYSVRPYPINENVPLHPHWVADMDYPSCPVIIDAITKVAEKGIYGYANTPKDLYKIISHYLSKQGWELSEEHLKEVMILSPGVVTGICVILTALTNVGDSIMFQTPSYPHFFESVEGIDRKVVNNRLIQKNGVWRIDFEDFEQQIISENVKVFLLCSPQNPTGRVFDKEELEQMVNICKKHNVIIISDEIHCDLLLTKQHIHTGSLPNAKDITITMLAPSKTYNIPGLSQAFMVCENDEMRSKIFHVASGLSICWGSLFGHIGMKTAYSGECSEWLKECIEYIKGNVKLITEFIQNQLPSIQITQPEATYLLWMDFSKYGISSDKIDDLLGQRGIIFNQGKAFGKGFDLFRRFNIATSKKEIQSVLDLLYDAFKPYEK